jgi:hypothetical protein
MRLRIAGINDLPIKESERKYHWSFGGPFGDFSVMFGAAAIKPINRRNTAVFPGLRSGAAGKD